MKIRSLLLFAALLAAPLALAADWPQFRGPDRTGISKETGLLKSWPKNGPALLWTYKDAGVGFSGPAVVGEMLYIMGGFEDTEYVLALDLKTQKELWRTKVGKLFSFQSWGDGPRATPTIDGDRLYALGGNGDLVCLDLTKKGFELWRKSLVTDMGGELMVSQGMSWGYSESPLVDEEKLICTPGGPQGTLAALDKKSGKTLWRSTELKQQAPYSSIVAADIQGVRQYIQTSYIDDDTGGFVSGIAAKDGKLLWSEPIFKSSSYAICPTPIVKGNLVYVTSGYGGGCHMFEINKAGNALKAKDLYSKKNQKVMKNTHGGVVLVGDHVYGHSETSIWVCQEFKTGNLAWDERNNLSCRSGSIVAADNRLYLYTDEGGVGLLVPNPMKWEEAGSFKVPEESKLRQTLPGLRRAGVWTHPVVANGRLYFRDQELIFCYDVREKK
jgi:outer membrane protein assembly factor BamB